MLADKPTELSRIKLKTWTRQPVPVISEHSAHLTPLSVDFRTWLWRYTYLLLISMLWHRQAIFKSKGDKLCSSAGCRIWTRDPRLQKNIVKLTVTWGIIDSYYLFSWHFQMIDIWFYWSSVIRYLQLNDPVKIIYHEIQTINFRKYCVHKLFLIVTSHCGLMTPYGDIISIW